MFQIPLKVSNFPAASGVKNGSRSLTLSWSQLEWAAISVGKKSLRHIHYHGTFSKHEIAYRTAIIYANLMQQGNSIVRSSAYEGLDPSEKSAISYYLGMTLTKAFLEQELHVPYLMHVDVYRERFKVQFRGDLRPDLFGRDTKGNWIVAEAKGRTNGHSAKALDKAKAQAKQITSIDSAKPILRLGCVASFKSGHLHLVADDPPADESETRQIDLSITADEFMFDYYAPFRAMLEPSPDDLQGEPAQLVTFKNQRIEALRFGPLDLVVGLVESHIGRHTTEANYLRPARLARENSFLGGDGIFVELGSSWSDAMMTLEPQLRSRLP